MINIFDLGNRKKGRHLPLECYKSMIVVFSVVCPTKYLESNVKQFLMFYYFVPAMASSAIERIGS